MSNGNRIGIEVQVGFPSVTKMKAELAKKWKGVKDSFEAKINIGVDNNSLRSTRARIQRILGDDVYELKIKANAVSALKEISKVRAELRRIDEALAKKRELKIHIDTSSLTKPLSKVKENIGQIDTASKAYNDSLKKQNTELDKTLGKYSKIQRVQKLMKDGTMQSTIKGTYKSESGRETVQTVRDGKLISQTETDNRLNALKEIEGMLKRIHALNEKITTATGKHNYLLQKERRSEQEILNNLMDNYKEKYKQNALDEKSIQIVNRRNKAELEIKKNTIEVKKAKEELTAKEKEIASAISKVASLEKQKISIANKLVDAKESEKIHLQEQYRFYDKNQSKLMETYNLQSRMTQAQREELDNLKTIGRAEVARRQAKKEQIENEKRLNAIQAERQKKEKATLDSMMSDLRNIHKLETQILSIQERAKASKQQLTNEEQKSLSILQSELRTAQQMSKIYAEQAKSAGLVTQKTKEALAIESQLLSKEKSRVAETAKISGEYEKANNALKEFKKITSQIDSLQRDLVFAGSREQDIIEAQIGALKKKQSLIEKGISSEKRMGSAIRKEIDAIKKAQSEQIKLNRLRQEARERDVAYKYTDTGGVINPHTVYANARQASHHILEPIARIDEALVGITKVADATEEQFNDFASSSFGVSSKLGVTADEYMLAVQKWVTAGKTFTESQEWAKQSLIGSFVGNIAPDDMVKYMAVPFEAFKNHGIETTDIINVMNETSNNHAIEMDELGKAYARSSITAREAGMSFEQLTGMITGAQESTRRGGEVIGRGIKTMGINISKIFSRIERGDKKKYNFFDSIGVSFEDDEGKIKSMYQIFDEINNVWDTLSDDQKGTAKFYLAGKEHAETMSGIIDQWDTSVADTVKDASGELGRGDKGSAYIEHAKQMDSVKFKLAELKNSWDMLMLTIAGGGDGVSKVLDVMINGLKMMTKLAESEGFMTFMKFLAGSIGMRAGANGLKRMFDMMETGAKGFKRDSAIILGQMGLLDKKSKKITAKNLAPAVKYAKPKPTVIKQPPVIYKQPVTPKPPKQNVHSNTNQDSNNKKGAVLVGGHKGGYIKNSPVKSKDIESANKAMDSVTKKAGTLSRTIKSSLGLVPLLGEGLLIAEIIGIPVFDTIGSGFDKLFKSAQEAREEVEQAFMSFSAKNSIMNGMVKEYNRSYNELEKSLSSKTGKKGYMNEDEFLQFQNQFNTLSSEMGLTDEYGVAIEVTMNNTDHIEEKLKTMKKMLADVNKEALIEIGKEVKAGKDSIGDKEKEIKSQEKKIDKINKGIDKAKKRIAELEASGKGDSSAHKSQTQVLEYGLKNIEKHKEKIHELQLDIQQLETNASEYAKSIVRHVADGGSVAGMDAQALHEVFQELSADYDGMIGKNELLGKAIKDLNSEQGITEGQWKRIQQLAPELSKINYQEIQENEKKRQSAIDLATSEKERTDKAISNTKSAILAILEELGVKAQLNKKTGEITVSQSELNEKTGENITKVGALKKAIGLLKGKTIKVSADKVKESTEKVKGLKTSVDGVKSKTVTITAKILKKASNVWGMLSGGSNKSVSSSSIASSYNQAISSASVSSSSVSQPASAPSISNVSSTDMAKSSKKKSSKKSTKPKNNSRVDKDIWRYWQTERKIDISENAINKLSNAISESSDNHKELIKLYTKQNSLLSTQRSQNRSLASKKQSELNSTLRTLRGYGFKTKGNEITNIGISKKFKGEKAEKVEKQLSNWRSLVGDLSSITSEINSLSSQIKQNKKDIKQAKIDRELKAWEKNIKSINAVLTKVENATTVTGLKLGLVSPADFEKSLATYEEALVQSKSNMTALMNEYNRMAVKKISYKETGEEVLSNLESLKDSILSQADAMVEYKKSLNDMKISRIASDLERFNSAIDDNASKMSNNIDNLREGLLSGTKLSDLQSATLGKLGIQRDNKFGKVEDQRVKLEKDLQKTLDKFAKRNVDRHKKVTNAQLKISASAYSELLRIQKEFNKGKSVVPKKIKDTYKDVAGIVNADPSYKLIKDLDKYFKAVNDKQVALNKKYQSDMNKARTQVAKDNLTEKYIIDSMKLQEKYFEATIKANKSAVSQLQSLLKDKNLTGEQKEEIRDLINDYQQGIIDAQNGIKDSIRDRFEYEFSLIQETMEKYDEAYKKVEHAMSLVDMLGGDNHEARAIILDRMTKLESKRGKELEGILEKLESQQSLYEKGSFEWKIINEQVKEYKDLIDESNLSLLEMNKSLLENSFAGTIKNIEKSLFDGKSLDEFELQRDLWLTGLERDIALEDTYERLAELNSQIHNDKIAQLEKQEKLSKFEMEYLNKQLDILELQQKLENLNKERNVQVLKQKLDGTWSWEYEANSEDIKATEEEIKDAQLELIEMEKEARIDYLSKLESILSRAENGDFSNEQELRTSLNELVKAYESVVGDIPEIQGKYIDEIIKSFNKYNQGIKDVVSGNNSIGNVKNETIDKITNGMDDIIKNLANSIGEAFTKSIKSLSKNSATLRALDGNVTNIHLDKVEFPNATNGKDIQDALLSLPQLALQRSKQK